VLQKTKYLQYALRQTVPACEVLTGHQGFRAGQNLGEVRYRAPNPEPNQDLRAMRGQVVWRCAYCS